MPGTIFSEKRKAKMAYADQSKIDPKLKWPKFWQDWKYNLQHQPQLKIQLAFKHGKPTADTAEGRCLLWQKVAFGRL